MNPGKTATSPRLRVLAGVMATALLALWGWSVIIAIGSMGNPYASFSLMPAGFATLSCLPAGLSLLGAAMAGSRGAAILGLVMFAFVIAFCVLHFVGLQPPVLTFDAIMFLTGCALCFYLWRY